MSEQPTALGYAIGLEARGYAAEASELRRLHAEVNELKRTLALLQQSYEREIQIEVEAERERYNALLGDYHAVIETLEEMQAAVTAEREALTSMLKGVDKTETESADGWWETSTGAEFGAGILAAIRARNKP
jgi:succinate dehydrogenase/fumarate reductase flavoprotein subunit